MVTKIAKTLRVSRGFGSSVRCRSLRISIQDGYLWIGPEGTGPCFVYLSGKKTLHKIAAMLKAHAR